MLKTVQVDQGDYRIIANRTAGGTITLDTGVDKGKVIVTGDLNVRGSLTTVTGSV